MVLAFQIAVKINIIGVSLHCLRVQWWCTGHL